MTGIPRNIAGRIVATLNGKNLVLPSMKETPARHINIFDLANARTEEGNKVSSFVSRSVDRIAYIMERGPITKTK